MIPFCAIILGLVIDSVAFGVNLDLNQETLQITVTSESFLFFFFAILTHQLWSLPVKY